jgi:hypothetical protein
VEQSSSWEANSHSASQEIPHLLWNPKVYYRVHNSVPLVLILSQTDPVHKFPPSFPKIHFNIIYTSTPKSPAWSLPFVFPIKKKFVRIYHLPYASYMPCPSHPPWFLTIIIFGEEWRLWSSSLCNFLQSWVQIFSSPCPQTPSNWSFSLRFSSSHFWKQVSELKCVWTTVTDGWISGLAKELDEVLA